MTHAFPEDELRPISCKSLTRDRIDPSHVEINDVLGNYSLTLVDSLSTLAILASAPHLPGGAYKALDQFQGGVKDLVYQYGDGSQGPAGQGLRARGFDVDSKVQVFETAIRGMGGLLSAHLFATGDLPITGYKPPSEEAAYARTWPRNTAEDRQHGIRWKNGMVYDGQLLRLAYDLGSRLIPAFFTTTGIPYPRVNLRHGIPFYPNSTLDFDIEEGQCNSAQQGVAEITENCSAGAGSLVLEFTVLSRLTGDERFEKLAKRAFWAIWNRRSSIDLIGAGIDAENGQWIGPYTGIGAGIDSFFEYALKSHILLSREAHPAYMDSSHQKDPARFLPALSDHEESADAFLQAWTEAHSAIRRHLYRGRSYQHPHYVQADLYTGATRAFWIDSLSAYFPGLLTLAGELEEAIETHLLSTALWTRFSALPERWNLATGDVEGGLGWWVGRPEFIESTYHLYRATQDPWYLHVGEMVLRDIKRRCWTSCGWAGLQDVRSGELNDRMESFFLGETAKYLYLLFDPGHPLNHLDEPFVFTTEGHPLIIPRGVGPSSRRTTSSSTVLSKTPPVCPIPPPAIPLTVSSTAARDDIFHAAALARLHLMPRWDTGDSILGDYAVDHASITLSDISSPSNYTYFPWTLPPQLVPTGAISAAMAARPTFDITFPPLPNNGLPSPPLQRVKDGILINYVSGLRLGMIQDVPLQIEDALKDGYRIQLINNLALGKDEKVFLPKDTTHDVLNPTDPNFTRVRDSGLLNLVVDVNTPLPVQNQTETAIDFTLDDQLSPSVKSALGSLLAQVSSLVQHSQSSLFGSDTDASTEPGTIRFYIPAVTPAGIGAAAIPDWEEAPSPSPSSSDPTIVSLSWTKVYATDELCNQKLPFSVPRTHQILVVKRGGCSFSRKLANIPAFAPSKTSLQLVVMVSYEQEGGMQGDWLIKPYLDQQQFTSGGLMRHNPIPMVMVGGGCRSYEALKNARGIGVKRRYTMEAQGVPISNLFIV